MCASQHLVEKCLGWNWLGSGLASSFLFVLFFFWYGLFFLLIVYVCLRWNFDLVWFVSVCSFCRCPVFSNGFSIWILLAPDL